ncbi:YqgQ family protein [Bacillus sp. B190/17]|uniref:YqgQ family protein n=1 Tax=Bacillus lumedeiriae TaxID=3058829 RepID=A0ABW8I6Q0_9BACI
MKTMWDVQQLLKRYGVFVYVGDRLADLELMEAELRDLYQSQLMEGQEFQQAVLILRRERRMEKEKQARRS